MRKLHGRQCQVEVVEPALAREFIKDHHRQGAPRHYKSDISIGLFHQTELVGVAVFGTPRTEAMQRKYTTEIRRMCFGDIRVMGGASKMIRWFISVFKPFDLMTYQHAGGGNTDVYLHAGMTLVSEAKPKRVLVRNGLTAQTATNNRLDWFSIDQASRFGPDTLLGTSLGEVFRDDGARVSNVDLFTEHCDYHLETVPGDHLFAWHNPNFSFYTYRITAPGSDKYYIGRRKIHVTNAAEADCLRDRYFGSGGTKFQNWLANYGGDFGQNLNKEILGIYRTWGEAAEAERVLVSSRHLVDPLCLNSIEGGKGGSGIVRGEDDTAACPVHGLTKHTSGGQCRKCATAKGKSIQACPVHGESVFYGKNCQACALTVSMRSLHCPVHGVTIHIGGICRKCASRKMNSTQDCPKHGTVTFQGDKCLKCQAERTNTMKECPTHGATKHTGNTCRKCAVAKRDTVQECTEHGAVKHRGGRCLTCMNRSKTTTAHCDTHGQTTFHNDECAKCAASQHHSTRVCSVHGTARFIGDTCYKCAVAVSDTVKVCPVHGMAKHRGNSCYKCSNSKGFEVRHCPVHGEAKHKGDKCHKCSLAKSSSMKECRVHGMTSFNGKSCRKCAWQKRSDAKKAV